MLADPHYYLTPGPSELYFTVADHLKQALREKVASISHRSKAFEAYYAHAVSELRQLLNLPETHHILFTASATEVWERLLQNCVEECPFHLVNGSFSERFFEFSQLLGLNAAVVKVPLGKGFDLDSVQVPGNAEMICITQNETSTGVSMPMEDIAALRRAHPDKLLVVDAVSSVPFPEFNFQHIDSLFFSVQKGMGLPAGLGVWIVNHRCIERAEALQKKGRAIGTYHSLPALMEKGLKNQNPETPNMLGIYLLGKVAEDMNRRGITAIRQETQYKAALIYGLYERLGFLAPAVEKKEHRSKTVLVANVNGMSPAELITSLKAQGIVVGSGYGKLKERQIRIANFPTHSKEIFERLADLLEAMA